MTARVASIRRTDLVELLRSARTGGLTRDTDGDWRRVASPRPGYGTDRPRLVPVGPGLIRILATQGLIVLVGQTWQLTYTGTARLSTEETRHAG